MILEIRHLRILDAIGREGTVTAAAERVFLTQPAVSHALKELESRLKSELFRRTGRRMEPTAAGLRLLRTAERVLAEIERAEAEFEHIAEGRRGPLCIATQCYTSYPWVPEAVAELEESFPGIELQIVPAARADPTRALLSGRIDLAIVDRLPPHSEIALEPLLEDEYVAIMAPEHRLASRSRLEPSDFANEHLLLHSSPTRSSVITEFLEPAGVSPKRISRLGLSETVVDTVKAGLGVAAVTSWMVSNELSAGSLTFARLGTEGLKRTWYAAVLRKKLRRRALISLIEILRRQPIGTAASPSTGSEKRSPTHVGQPGSRLRSA